MKQVFDLLAAIILSLLLMPLILIVALMVFISSKGPIIYWSKRVGLNNEIFLMPKFRTMKINTPVLATHLLKDSSSYLTPVGSFLRRTSLDELPQLYSIIIGNMRLVGPRPALFNQYDLIKLRSKFGVDKIKPGITGLAQINGRDNLSIKEKVNLDYEYLKNHSLMLDIKILLRTSLKIFKDKEISH